MQALFEQLDQLLLRYRDFWQFRPFSSVHSRWQQLEPGLHQAVSALPDQDVALLEADPEKLADFLTPWISDAAQLVSLTVLPDLPERALCFEQSLDYRVQGRKWQQIKHFARRVPERASILEWCAGKGHLGRLLAAGGASDVCSLEWQENLCADGQALAQRAGVHMQFVHLDVMQTGAADYLTQDTHAVALHACGELHHRLLELVAGQKAQGLLLAPCCFNLIGSAYYQPVSGPGQGSRLRLDKNDLKMPLRRTVTAGQRERTARYRQLVWRLGFDCLQRELRGRDEYLPLPAAPGVVMRGDFASFIAWAAAQKQLQLPESIDIAGFEAAGRQRYQTVRQMELVQLLFQRPLELWLLLDKALFLQEHGYRVRVGRFCDYQLTPRNWAIQAERGEVAGTGAVIASASE